MTSPKQRIASYIENPELLNEESLLWLGEIIKNFPHFEVARILYLKNLKQTENFHFLKVLQQSAAHIQDREHLKSYLNEAKKDAEIDCKAEEELIIEPVYDISREYSLQEKEKPDTEIKEKPKFFNPVEMAKKSVVFNDDLITETLAEILVKQGDTEKAVKIYEQLALKYPKKSSYFAGRIENLKKNNKKI